jgi:predicted CXXCH cytochrome family protein
VIANNASSGLNFVLAICGGLVLLAVAAVPAFPAEHPAISKESACISCHVEKTKGQSIHFDFTNSCTVCHVVRVDDGKTSISLAIPKEKICYSCHEKAALDKMQFMKGECVSCHDPHNSERPHLLRKGVSAPAETSKR